MTVLRDYAETGEFGEPEQPRRTRSEWPRREGAKTSYNYCGVCGRVPHDESEESNYAPLRWYDPDDGWRIGTLCRWCWTEVKDAVPQEGDYAYHKTNGVCDDENTDEDAILAL